MQAHSQDDAKNMKRKNWERQIAKNDKLQYLFQKNFQSFNRLTQINFLYWQNVQYDA